MARKPRIHIPSAFYHVMLRGNAGDDIFFSNEERRHFCSLLQDGVTRFSYRIHAFCLMDNHVHLVIQVGNTSLSTIMQNLTSRYTRWFNSRHKRIGHLFQGRFKAIMVDEESYLLELVRYVHLNPVRAGMVNQLDEHHWNSNMAYAGDMTCSWLYTDEVLSMFSSNHDTARANFAQFMDEGESVSHRPEFHGGEIDARILGDDRFAERVLCDDRANNNNACSLTKAIEIVSQHYGVSASALSERGRLRNLSEARAVIAWLLRNHGKESLSEVARYFNRDISTMSSAVRRLEEKMRAKDSLRKAIKAIESEIK